MKNRKRIKVGIFSSLFFFFLMNYKDKTASPLITTSKQKGQQPNSKDYSLLGNPKMVGVGGILWNSSGLWVSSFSLNLGIASNNMPKLWAIR